MVAVVEKWMSIAIPLCCTSSRRVGILAVVWDRLAGTKAARDPVTQMVSVGGFNVRYSNSSLSSPLEIPRLID